MGYVLATLGIKPQPKKVQAILTLTLPTGVKDLCRFLGMVQYYQRSLGKVQQNACPTHLTVGDRGHTKVTRARKTKVHLQESHF